MKEITAFRKYLNEGLDKKTDKVKENIDMSNNDGYKAFVDNEDILGKYSIKDAEEMAKELAMTHFDYDDPRQVRFEKDFINAYEEGDY